MADGYVYRIVFYHPYEGKGGAMQFELAGNKSCFFLSMANELGERKFDWENKITMKLDGNDLGDLLMLCDGRKTGLGREKDGKWAGLFHKNTSGTTILNISRKDSNDGFYMSISTGAKNRVNMSLSDTELVLMGYFIKDHMRDVFRVNFDGSMGVPRNDDNQVEENNQPDENKRTPPQAKITNKSTTNKTSKQPVLNGDLPF